MLRNCLRRLLLFVMLLATLPVFAQTFESGGIYYNLHYDYDDSGNYISVCAEVTYPQDGSKYSGEIVIPASVENEGIEYRVLAIGYAAFRDCSSLKYIKLPSSLTTIGNYAFSCC